MTNNKRTRLEITEKDIRIVKINGKYGYQYPDGSWMVESDFDEAYEFIDGYATVVKEGMKGWISFDGDSAYCPWTPQERWLREDKRKRERKKKIRRILGLRETKPMNLEYWDEDDHNWLVNKLHKGWEKFKENPVIPITIIYGTAILIYTFFFE